MSHFALPGQGTPDPELESIEATLLDYIEGTAKGQPSRLRKAFHPDFNLYTVNDADSLWIRDGEAYIGYFKEGVSNNRIERIIDIDYERNAATAKVEVTVPGWRVFTDYFLLLKYLGSWKIVHKSYSWREISAQDKYSHLDSIFASVDRPDHPALVALALHQGEVVYKKAFGSADITHEIPATINSQFQLSTMSRQFTAFAILLLEEEGRLSLRDDIRRYLPSLPAYDQVITVDHLLSTSSGLSDIWPMLEMQGITDEDVVTQEEALAMIQQLDAVFAPGEDHIYGHTDQVLLAEIVAKASGKSFKRFMEEEVFQPLGMTSTKIKDVGGEGLNHLAAYYLPSDAGFRRTNSDLQLLGPINVYSTIDDLAKWELNLLEPKVGNEQLVEKLSTSCRTNDGKTMYTLRGEWSYGQQFYHWGHGVKELYQIGFLGGHASAIFKFPDQDFTVIILSSGMEYSGYLGMGLAQHFIGESFKDEEIDFSAVKTQSLKEKQLRPVVGKYWSDRACISRSIELKNDTLRYIRSDGRENALIPVAQNKFQMMIGGGEEIFVTFEKARMTFQSGAARPLDFTKVPSVDIAPSQLEALVGRYYNESLNIVYQLSVEKGSLVAIHPKGGKIGLTPISDRLYQGDQWYFASIEFDEDRTGFTLATEQVKGLRFRRM